MDPFMPIKPEPHEIESNLTNFSPETDIAQPKVEGDAPATIDAACGLSKTEPKEEACNNVISVHETIDTDMHDTDAPAESMSGTQGGVPLDQDGNCGFNSTRPAMPKPSVKVEEEEEEEEKIYVSIYKPNKFGESKGLPMVRVENPDDTPIVTPLSYVPTHQRFDPFDLEICNPRAEAPFLKLPSKLRMKILQHCVPTKPLSLARTRQHYIRDTNRQNIPRVREDATTTIAWTSLFAVTWLIHCEYTEVFYNKAQLRLTFPEDYHLIRAVEDWTFDSYLFRPCWAPAFKAPDFCNLTMKVRADGKRKDDETLAFEYLKSVVRVRDDLSFRRVTVDLSDYDPKKGARKDEKWLFRLPGRKDGYQEAWDNVADEVVEMIRSCNLEVWVQFWKSEGEDGPHQAVQPTFTEFIEKCTDGNIDVKAW